MNGMKMIFLILLFVFGVKTKSLIAFLKGNHNTNDHDKCFWRLRDTPQDRRVVHSLRHECMQGSLTWLNPFGGLEVTFHLPATPPLDPFVDKNAKRAFCYSIEQKHTEVKVDREVNNLKNTSSTTLPSEDCIDNNNVKIYAESVPNTISNIIGEFTFKHVWRTYTPFEKCRKCTLDETNQSFCSSQFVSKGKVAWKKGGGLNFHVTEVIRSSADVINSLLQSASTLEATRNIDPDEQHNQHHSKQRSLRSHQPHHFHHHSHSNPHHSHHSYHHPHSGSPHHYRNKFPFSNRLNNQETRYGKDVSNIVTQHRQYQQQHFKQLRQQKQLLQEMHNFKNIKKVIRIKNKNCKMHEIFHKNTEENVRSGNISDLPNSKHSQNNKKSNNHIKKHHKNPHHHYIIMGDFILGKLNVACLIDQPEFEASWQKLVDGNQNMCLYKQP